MKHLSPTFEIIQDKNPLKILSPGLKNRKTAKIKLSNSLEVYLVSDPNADKSAASLAMEVGSWADPKDYPGMAHFCEHLLFMGTETYPKENYFESCVKDNGGTYNAYTAADRTVYMFTSNHKSFLDILDQFAHFFIDPAFDPSGIQRELHAVDQESDMYQENDLWRAYMVFKEKGNPNHPNALFSVGNAETLGKIPLEALKEWYLQHYSAHKAHLVLYAPCSIRELTEMAVNYFSGIPIRTTATPFCLERLSSSAQQGQITYIEPIKDIRKLSLTWELPAIYTADIANKVPHLVAYIMDCKGSNSLYAELKKEKLAENIEVGVERLGSNGLFSIEVPFTKNAEMLPIDKVITLCFQSIASLQKTGVPQYLFEQMYTMSKLKYTYQSRKNAFDFVMDCASQLIDEPLATYPLKTLLPTDYEASQYKKFVSLLTPQHCIFQVIAPTKLTGVVPDKREKWYKVAYSTQSIPFDQLSALQQQTRHPHIALPTKNLFVPSSLTLVTNLKRVTTTPEPQLLEAGSQGKVYFYPDDRYGVPNIAWFFYIKTPLIDGSAKQKVLLELYIKGLKQALANVLDDAEKAGLIGSFSQKNLALVVSLQGYSSKAFLLLTRLLDKMVGYNASKQDFAMFGASLKRSYENRSKAKPVRQVFDLCRQVLYNDVPAYRVCLEELACISYEEFCIFSKSLFGMAYVEAFLGGNLTQKEAVDVWHLVKGKLVAKAYLVDRHHTKKYLVLPKASGPYKILKKISMQGHAACVVLQAGEFSFEKRAALQIFNIVLQDGYFDTLRTKQQVAYLVYCAVKEEVGQLSQLFAIQSSTHIPEDLLARTEAFIESCVKDFSRYLSKIRFKNIRQQLIVSLQTPPPDLGRMSNRLRKMAFEYGADFLRINKLVEALKKITYEQVRSYAVALASPNNRRRIAFLVEGRMLNGKSFQYKCVGIDEVKGKGGYTL